MSDKEKKGTHLNLPDRMFIENALFEHMPLKEIARKLGKDSTTISKEIRRNRIENRSRVGKDYVLCQHYKGCRKMHLCKESCSHMCYRCKITNCYRICSDTYRTILILLLWKCIKNHSGRYPLTISTADGIYSCNSIPAVCLACR